MPRIVKSSASHSLQELATVHTISLSNHSVERPIITLRRQDAQTNFARTELRAKFLHQLLCVIAVAKTRQDNAGIGGFGH
jgi:hypothetical protein